MAFLRKYRLTINFPEILFEGGIFEGVGLTNLEAFGPQEAIILREHQITFTVDKSTKKPLDGIKLQVFNLPKAFRERIVSDAQIKLEVGYSDEDFKQGEGTLAPIFLGFIKSYHNDSSKEDIVTNLVCKDGWVNVREGYTFRGFPSGSTTRQAIEEIAKFDMHLNDVIYDSDKLETLDAKRSNGITVMGGSYQAIQDLCSARNLQCSIRDGNLVVDNLKGSSKITLLNITESSGLIGAATRVNPADNKRLGVPEGTEGLKFKILLNPEIVPNSEITLDTRDFIAILRVISVKHVGDFEGQNWFSEIVAKVVSGIEKRGQEVTT